MPTRWRPEADGTRANTRFFHPLPDGFQVIPH